MKRSIALFLVISLTVGSFIGCANTAYTSDEDSTFLTEAANTTASAVETAASEPDQDSTDTTEHSAPSTAETTEDNREEDTKIDPDMQFSLDVNAISFSETGESQLIYSGPISVSEIIWTTDNEKVAAVKDGVVTAVAAGSTRVYGKYGNIRIACDVTCEIAEETVPETTVAVDSNAPVMSPPDYQTVDASFFDDALFIGDSVTDGLRLNGGVGNAKFACRASYSVCNELAGDNLLQLFGVSTSVEQIVAYYNPGKIFIMLGLNELSVASTLMPSWSIYLSRIRSAAPNAKIYIQSVTPVYTNGQNYSWGVTNENVEIINANLRQFAADNGCKFIDVAPYMRDATGGLAGVYTYDNYVHMSAEGCKTWIKVLYALCG